jgi:hypothetical protein
MFEREYPVESKTKKITLKKEIVTKTETITIEIPFEPLDNKRIPPVVFNEILEPSLMDDSESRVELAKILSLPNLPEKSDYAFDALNGLFDDLVGPNEEVDVVKWVKDLRRGK